MKEKNHFMDKNTLIAVGLIFIAWFSWDAYMRKNYPSPSSVPLAVEEKKEQAEKTDSLSQKPSNLAKKKKNTSKIKQNPEQVFSFESPELTLLLSSKGMGFKKIVLNKIRDRQNQKIKFFDLKDLSLENVEENEKSASKIFLRKRLPFETYISSDEKALDFQIKQISDKIWEGKALLKEGVSVTKTLEILPEQFTVKTKVILSGKLREGMFVKTFLIQLDKELKKTNSLFAMFVLPDLLSLFVSSKTGIHQKPFPPLEDEQETLEFVSEVPRNGVRAAAVGSKYFGQAILDKSSVQPEFTMHSLSKKWIGVLKHTVLSVDQDFVLSYQTFMGPKILRLLKEKSPELVEWVDFGFFGILSRFILEILSFFHSLVGNWGVSIILLTLLVRLLLLPLVLSSHRSMAVMKKIQPELQKIKEKFKKDPQRMNQEVMALMKTHRANPLGGCLPMLLQIPIFWALWRALSNSYSLYQSPFIFWIQDLSHKDPFYILPVLIGVAMFVQQKVSPAIGNKEIARAMQILPIFMVLIMISLPSGLTLYVLISSAFGLLQQVYLNKEQALLGGASVSEKKPETKQIDNESKIK